MDEALAENRQQSAEPVGGAVSGSEKIVLNVGCGYRSPQNLHSRFHSSEWREVRIDIDPAVQPDFVCSITALTPIASDSVDAVWASHNLEHIHHHEVPSALGEFFRVLKPGGLLLLTTPNLQKAAEFVAHDQLEHEVYRSPAGPITPLDMIFGHTASLARGKAFMAHKTGFTARTLQRLLTDTGFTDLRLSQDQFDLWAAASKPF
jgi:predicted SAM-dependent methyltransferase